ncbi:MAG: hypothetical protein FIB00_07205 [Chloroflexi bacterium]|nr:hypothetical protein [Chloroflexota bacterium]
MDPVGIAAGYDPLGSARRIDVALRTGRTLGWWQRHAPAGAEPVPARVFVLELPRAELYRRINERVDRMIEQGLVAEVRELLAHGYDLCDPGMKAVGYIELVPYLRGEGTLAEAVLLIKNATRRYARRQLTWFRRQLPAGHTSLDATVAVTDLADRVSAAWGRDEP